MTTTLADLLTVRSEDTVLTAFLTDLAALDVPTTGWQATSIQSALTRLCARNQAAAETLRDKVVRGGYLDTATLGWLDLLAQGFFALLRSPSTATVQQVRITDTSAGSALDKAARTVRIKHDATGVTYMNAEAFHVDASGYTDVRFLCESLGSAGNVAPSASWSFVTSLPGYTATNPIVGSTGTSVLVVGSDAETDAAYRTRARARWSTLGAGGNAGAVVYRIGYVDATVTRYLLDDANPTGPGSLDVYIATEAGTATSDQVDAVDAYLQPRKAVGTGQLRTFAAPLVTQAVVATLYTDGSNASAATDAANALARISPSSDPSVTANGLGGTLYVLGDIVPALMSVDGALNVAVTTPAADVVLGISDRLVFSPTITVV